LVFSSSWKGAGLLRHPPATESDRQNIFGASHYQRSARRAMHGKTRPVTRTGKARETACWNAEAQQWAIPWTPAIRMKTGTRSLS
jgi:hypothetical protein